MYFTRHRHIPQITPKSHSKYTQNALKCSKPKKHSLSGDFRQIYRDDTWFSDFPVIKVCFMKLSFSSPFMFSGEEEEI